MDDTISRKAAIDAMAELQGRASSKGELTGISKAWKRIKKLPPIQPEQQEGYWIRTDCGLDVECKCSRCGYKDFVEPRDEYWFKRNYCPNCGAKMKGEANER